MDPIRTVSMRRLSGARTPILLSTALLLFALASLAQAQQTVFNVPTTDILDQGKVYLEADISFKLHDSRALSRYSSVVPRVVVGVRQRRVEVGMNVTGNIQPGKDSTTLVPTVKVKVYENEKHGVAVVTGANVFIPVRQRVYRAGAYTYAMVSKTLGSRTRVGAGAYLFTENVVSPNANRGGFQFTFEQAITRRFSFNADWITGNHAAGYLTFGPSFKFSKRLVGAAAYSIGNNNYSDGNHFFYVQVGYLVN
jgi:hypothetical protein